jgi:hypothetical protein
MPKKFVDHTMRELSEQYKERRGETRLQVAGIISVFCPATTGKRHEVHDTMDDPQDKDNEYNVADADILHEASL